MSTTQEQVSYPLPVIHMNGTGAEDLMAGYENIYDCINKLQAAMEKCIVHARDYYPLDIDFSEDSLLNDNFEGAVLKLTEIAPETCFHSGGNCEAAWNERYKHNKAVNDFKDYIFEHMLHINDQSK
tara:strand:- start:181 stop:558 length:378 start_codon:yes stop_codon:yes gene_type:complete